jgi:hypothetical protein
VRVNLAGEGEEEFNQPLWIISNLEEVITEIIATVYSVFSEIILQV